MTNAEARFNKIHIRKVYACLAVTCHLHFWQNDRDFLRATVVTRGWNGYRNKSQHRKLTLEKKILPLFQQGFEPATFQSRVRCSNHWAIPAPLDSSCFSWSPLYSRLTVLACNSTWVNSFSWRPRLLNIHRSGVLTALEWLVPHETAAISAHHTTMLLLPWIDLLHQVEGSVTL